MFERIAGTANGVHGCPVKSVVALLQSKAGHTVWWIRGLRTDDVVVDHVGLLQIHFQPVVTCGELVIRVNTKRSVQISIHRIERAITGN